MKNTTKTGNYAEQAVAEELVRQKYTVHTLNWKTRSAEIDIVAQKDKTMYFVEVKYRQNLCAGDGFDYITAQKLQHMQRAAESWVSEHDWRGEYVLLAAAVHGPLDDPAVDIREI